MLSYTIGCHAPHRKYLQIKIKATTEGKATLRLQLSAWRPGRYELANYAQNIRGLIAKDENGNTLFSKKTTKELWEIDTQKAAEVLVEYEYYANQLDAGASYVDDTQLYINPVNCLMYVEGRIEESSSLRIAIPAHYQIASSASFDANQTALFSDYHELADTPFIASSQLKKISYTSSDKNFHLWFCGNVHPDEEKILSDFKKFTDAQIKLFGDFPAPEFHFLFQLPDYKHYHGVEHLASTVICLGPAHDMMGKETYSSFLGISSHELFHCWNIKTIRPAEMFPYNYTKENYSVLGYVAEGITTYYGDLMLLRSGVYSWNDYAGEITDFLQRHFHVFGRYYMSLAESSFETWVDGYKPTGTPDRRVNMYVKGLLVSFMMDIHIRENTHNNASLDDVMRRLYIDFGKKKKGYSETDFLSLVSEISFKDFTSFFNNYVWGLKPIEEELNRCLNYLGCELVMSKAAKKTEAILGFKTNENSKAVITAIAPDSPADKVGLYISDEIIAVNDSQVDSPSMLNTLINFQNTNEYRLHFFRNKKLCMADVKSDGNFYFDNLSIRKQADATEEGINNFSKWSWQNQ